MMLFSPGPEKCPEFIQTSEFFKLNVIFFINSINKKRRMLHTRPD